LHLFGKELDGNATAEMAVLGLVHHSHAAGSELTQNPVVRDGAADFDLHAATFSLAGTPLFRPAPTRLIGGSDWTIRRVGMRGQPKLEPPFAWTAALRVSRLARDRPTLGDRGRDDQSRPTGRPHGGRRGARVPPDWFLMRSMSWRAC